MKKLLDIAKERRATKVYNGKLISTDDLQYIFEVTNTAPTSMGAEAWRVLDIRDKDLKLKLKPFLLFNASCMSTASDVVIFITKKAEAFYDTPWIKTRISHLLKEIDYTFKTNKANNPEEINKLVEFYKIHDSGDNNRNHTEWSKRQAYIAIAYMMLAAKEIGIDSTPVEGFIGSSLNNFLLEKKLMENDENVSIIILLGYRASIEKHPFLGKEQTRILVSEKFIVK